MVKMKIQTVANLSDPTTDHQLLQQVKLSLSLIICVLANETTEVQCAYYVHLRSSSHFTISSQRHLSSEHSGHTKAKKKNTVKV